MEGVGGRRKKVLSGVVKLCFGCYGGKKNKRIFGDNLGVYEEVLWVKIRF